jgi:hypothetical protein
VSIGRVWNGTDNNTYLDSSQSWNDFNTVLDAVGVSASLAQIPMSVGRLATLRSFSQRFRNVPFSQINRTQRKLMQRELATVLDEVGNNKQFQSWLASNGLRPAMDSQTIGKLAQTELLGAAGAFIGDLQSIRSPESGALNRASANVRYLVHVVQDRPSR